MRTFTASTAKTTLTVEASTSLTAEATRASTAKTALTGTTLGTTRAGRKYTSGGE